MNGNGLALKQFREGKNLSIRTLAASLGYSATYVHEIENGKKLGSRSFWQAAQEKYPELSSLDIGKSWVTLETIEAELAEILEMLKNVIKERQEHQ